ncbi:MAG: hypothetical protein QXK54_07230 [Ignisphaera sp.]
MFFALQIKITLTLDRKYIEIVYYRIQKMVKPYSGLVYISCIFL